MKSPQLPSTIVAFFWRFIKRQPVGFFLLFFTALVWSVNETFFPYFLKLIVNTLHDFKGSQQQIFSALKLPLIALIALWIIMESAMRVQGLLIVRIFPKLRAQIRMDVYDYTKQHSYEYFSNNFAGSIAKKLSELPNSAQTMVEILCFNFTSILVAFFIALTLMWLTKPLFALILLGWFVLHMLVTWYFLKIGNVKWEQHAEAATLLSGKIIDSLTNIANVQLFARGGYESEYLEEFQAIEISKAKSAMFTLEMMRLLQGILGFLFIIVMILLLIEGWSKGWVTLGDFTLIGMLSFWMMGMIWFMSYQLTIFVREVGIVNEALTLISQSHDIVDQPNAWSLQVTQGEIDFSHVNFSYREQEVFDDLNIKIKAKQKVGLVGFSGAGKSTFVNLLLRLYDIQSGEILIDKQNIAFVTQESLRRQIAVIPQSPILFHRSLMDNIRYGRVEATDEEVIAAAKLAHCDEFIKQLPEGYEALVGERGVKLSGGQRQRIAIARAILKNAPILVLDEATSSLDSVTEKLIHESLQHLMHSATVIVIAHRLSTLTDMDRIIVFEHGKIIEDGSREELLKAGGHFAMLWQKQTDGFLPE